MDMIYALLGGLMIGCAAAAYLLMNGRVMGASGILGGVLDGTAKGSVAMERLVFLAGLVGVPALIGLGGVALPETNATTSVVVLVGAGLLVGIGTRIGSGCTSGHGVCGISRLSLRGITSTAIYMTAGILTVTALGGMI